MKKPGTTLVVLAIACVNSAAATLILNGSMVSTETMCEQEIEKQGLALHFARSDLNGNAMCDDALATAFPLLLESIPLPIGHPLRHPHPSVITSPLSFWPDGGMYIHEVVRFILGSKAEAAAARELLDIARFGPTGTHYLMEGESKSVADGKAFGNTRDAIAYLKENHASSVLYLTCSTSFPAALPRALDHSGLAFYTLDGHK